MCSVIPPPIRGLFYVKIDMISAPNTKEEKVADLFGNEEPVKTAKPIVRKNLSLENQSSANIHPLKSKTEIVPAMFENIPIRRILHNGIVYYSIVDVVAAIIGSNAPRQAWYKAKNAIKADGIELSTLSLQLKLTSSDGKKYLTDCADQAGIILIIEYLHSPKAAPFRVWFSHLVSERIEEIKNPSKGVDNAVKRWKQMGKSDEWISLRLKGIAVRNLETQTLKEHGIEKPKDFAYFTDKTNVAVYGQKAVTLKAERGLIKRENLRDHSSGVELSLLALHENACAGGMKSSNAYGKASVDKVYNAVGSIISSTKQALIFALGKEAVTA